MMMSNNIQLEERLVGQIKGEFYVPSYQRGYRWDESQVRQLLNDIIENGDKAYCLQPLVVRKKADGVFELIDGQQRLTTIFILLKYIKDNSYKPRLKIDFTLSYETRSGSADYLNSLDEQRAYENIDYWFMYNTYKTIDEWFKEKEKAGNDQQAADLFALYLFPKVGNGMGGYVKFIWYEVQDVEDKEAINLFTRLNIGRIPLTNAELVKALFLRKDDKQEVKLEEKRQLEISLQWDTIERELHDEDFWYFLTKEKAENYPTRIELLFDFISYNRENKRDPLSIFLHFNKQKVKAKKDLSEQWEEIVEYYYRLKEWYKKNDYYHKIGYLIASESRSMNEIVTATVGMRKTAQNEWLDDEIKASVKFPRVRYSELRYDTTYNYISRILLLFNVISVMDCANGNRFPFKVYSKEEWSLEHIHPQHPEQMKNDQNLWRVWIKDQEKTIHGIETVDKKAQKDDVLNSIKIFLNKDANTVDEFRTLSGKIVAIMSDTAEDELTHSISNMALLAKSQNSALNNSLFGTKRNKIIEMDKNGEFIPYCTRNVFLKYYTEEMDSQQMYLWTKDDRTDYIKAINNLLYKKHDYLREEITA